MPWLAVEKAYQFDGPRGKASLLDLFDGRRQLIVYRAFFEPGVLRLARTCLPRLLVGGRPGRAPRPSERPRHHARVRLARAAGRHRAPEGAHGLEACPGTPSPTASTPTSAWTSGTARTRSSATATSVFRTYFINSRGDEQMGNTWNYLDITALGRQEEWEDSPEGYPQTPPYKWWNWHDEYGDTRSSPWSSIVDCGLALQGQAVGSDADNVDPTESR